MADPKEEYYYKRALQLSKALLKIKKIINDLNLESGWVGEAEKVHP